MTYSAPACTRSCGTPGPYNSNIMLPTGGARIGDIDYQIDSDSMYESPQAMGYVPLATRSGNASFLHDVGVVEDASRIQTGRS